MADDPIRHIVVLMLENRSFDHILGGTKKMRDCYDLGGINKYGRKTYRQEPGIKRDIPGALGRLSDRIPATSRYTAAAYS